MTIHDTELIMTTVVTLTVDDADHLQLSCQRSVSVKEATEMCPLYDTAMFYTKTLEYSGQV